MRVLPVILSSLLLGAAPADVPIGQFREWLSFKKQPLDFTSGGVTVHVAALPCPALRSPSAIPHVDGKALTIRGR